MNDKDYEKIISKHIENCEDGKYVIYGTGGVAKIYYNKITEKYNDDRICFFIDGKYDKKEFLNKTVYAPEKLKGKNLQEYKFILGTVSKIPLFTQNLIDLGVRKEQIIRPICHFSPKYMLQNQKEIKKIFVYPKISELNNETLKYLFDDLINIKDNFESNKVSVLGYKIDSEILKKYDYNIEYFECFPEDFNSNDIVLVWDVEKIFDKEIANCDNIYCCDSSVVYHLYPRMIMAIAEIVNKNLTEKLEERSRENYLKLKEKCKDKNNALVCGMGPSFKENEEKIKKILPSSISIVCNTFYNVETDIIPMVYAMQDYDYCHLQRYQLEEIKNYIVKNKVFLFVPYNWLYLMDSSDKYLNELIIGLHPLDEQNNIVNENSMSYKDYANVVPAMLFSIAAGLNKNIYVVGCDGKNKSGKWEHSDGKIDEKFKRDKVFLQHDEADNWTEYEKAIDLMYEEFFKYAENKGIAFKVLTKSNYLQLQKRYDLNILK